LKFPALAIAFLLLLSSGCKTGRSEKSYLLFDSGKAFSYIEKQVAFGPRVPGTIAHSSCAGFLLETMAAFADTAWIDTWPHVSAKGDILKLANIRASFNPGAEERIFLCAHWDTRPVADQDPDPGNRQQPIPGANDGGSGVAVLLELARVFSLNRPEKGVDLALFDGEDYGDFYADQDVLIGSRRFAEFNRNYRPVLGILLDMVGDRNAAFLYEGNSRAALPKDCQLVWDTAERLGYGKIFLRQAGPAVIDDHIPLLNAGIHCIDIVQMGLPYWHTVGDTPDKLSPASLEAVGRTLAAVVYWLNSNN
jgi:hypothetical protein